MISKVGFIGAGKVGTTLGKYFAENGVHISGYYSRTNEHSRRSADFTNSLFFDELVDIINISDTIFVTVSDGEIAHVWSNIKDMDIDGKIIIHCSGVMTSEVFEGAKGRGAYAYSLHPLFAINSWKDSWQHMNKAYFTVEGDINRINDIKSLIQQTGNPISEIDAEAKTKYHAASVFFSNLVIGLAAAGEGIFLQCGLDKDFACNGWKSLFIGNAENMIDKGLAGALTGPVERADDKTIRKHLESLEGSDEIIYRELSRMILDIGKGKHPQRDYTEIDKELQK